MITIEHAKWFFLSWARGFQSLDFEVIGKVKHTIKTADRDNPTEQAHKCVAKATEMMKLEPGRYIFKTDNSYLNVQEYFIVTVPLVLGNETREIPIGRPDDESEPFDGLS